MEKKHKIILAVVALAVAGYLAWRWYQNRQAAQDGSPTGALGTNLNSVAPELVGGSAGPSVGPAVSLPVNITLTEQAAPLPEGNDGDEMKGRSRSANPVHRQRQGASIMQPGEVTGSNATPFTGPGGRTGATYAMDNPDEDTGDMSGP